MRGFLVREGGVAGGKEATFGTEIDERVCEVNEGRREWQVVFGSETGRGWSVERS